MRTLARTLGGFELAAGDLPAAIPAERYDLVTAAYVLGELPETALAATLDRAWAATAGALVIVEPGTPAGYGRVLAARSRLGAGARRGHERQDQEGDDGGDSPHCREKGTGDSEPPCPAGFLAHRSAQAGGGRDLGRQCEAMKLRMTEAARPHVSVSVKEVHSGRP